MAVIDPALRHIELKIVYVGPSLGGKTTNLHTLQRMLPAEQRSELTSIADADQRTLFFDYLPIDHPEVAGYSLKLKLYTVAGQEKYLASQHAILAGADGIVFVVDAQPARLEANKRSLTDLATWLSESGQAMDAFPLVLQYNKMDLPESIAAETMDQLFNPFALPSVPAIATEGAGVLETLRLVTKGAVGRL